MTRSTTSPAARQTTWRVDVPAELVTRGSAGDADALDGIARALHRPVYNLAVRFFWEPADAADATQEALLRILTRLPSFRGESSFGTWCYRVAVNEFLTTRRRSMERLTLAEGAAAIDEGLAHDRAGATYEGPDAELLAEEVRLSCTTALLVCLSRPLRMAYILGEILGMAGPEMAEVLEVAPAAARKRLSLARSQVRAFLADRCGLVAEDNPCRCRRQVAYDVSIGWVDPDRLRFASRDTGTAEQLHARRRLGAVLETAEVFLTHPEYAPPEGTRTALRGLLDQVDALSPATTRDGGHRPTPPDSGRPARS